MSVPSLALQDRVWICILNIDFESVPNLTRPVSARPIHYQHKDLVPSGRMINTNARANRVRKRFPQKELIYDACGWGQAVVPEK